MNISLTKQLVAEFVGTFALVFVGVGAIYQNAGLLAVAFAHGLAILVMAAAVGHISGAHFNPAVSFGLFIGGKMPLARMVAYWLAQLAGAVVAACLLLFVFAEVPGQVASQTLIKGTPDLLKEGITAVQGIVIEAVLTFFLVFVVYGSAVDGRAGKIAPIAIGFTVTLDILFNGPLTGAAMNPARAFGPALVSGYWHNHIVYWIGPLLGGAVGGLVYGRYLIKEP
ncbi:MAG: aquaporin [Verrucomicrobia subdivision 3 bacterium]|nr:aquaporin [Limisphaerales bacterium]